MLSYERQSTFSKNSFKFRNNNLKKYSSKDSRTINHEIVGIPPSRPTLQKKFIKGLKSPMYQCLDCDYVSDRKSNLSRHMEKHTQTREPPRCDVCHKSYNSKFNLKRHQRLHEFSQSSK
ncbi:hypothetical protein J3Q64DRAFT_1707708 [Phycomyces blakesleeanus]|uniref:C2H2-type domain-containing protein n=1 Tax=Phycomyces blakesleeanus TaxID=4837 RepID=A0ABR3BEY6_PHYBL